MADSMIVRMLYQEGLKTWQALICCIAASACCAPIFVAAYLGAHFHFTHPLWLGTFFMFSGFLIFNEIYVHTTSRPGVKWVYFKIYATTICIGVAAFLTMSCKPFVLTRAWPDIIWIYAVGVLVHYWVAMVMMSMSGSSDVYDDWNAKRLTLPISLFFNVFTVVLLLVLKCTVVGTIFIMHMYGGGATSGTEFVLTSLVYPLLRGCLKTLVFWICCKTNQVHREKVFEDVVLGFGPSNNQNAWAKPRAATEETKASDEVEQVQPHEANFADQPLPPQNKMAALAELDTRIEEKSVVCLTFGVCILFSTPGISAVCFISSWSTYFISLTVSGISEWLVDHLVLHSLLRHNITAQAILSFLRNWICLPCCRAKQGDFQDQGSWSQEMRKRERTMQQHRLAAHDFSEKVVCILAPLVAGYALEVAIAYAGDAGATAIRARLPSWPVLVARCACNLAFEIMTDLWKVWLFWKVYGIDMSSFSSPAKQHLEIGAVASAFLIATGALLAASGLYFN